MQTTLADFGSWHIECLPEDGGRISVIRYAGCDLLSPPPPLFSKPEKDWGEYENRPVYGYDDCFPTVDPCNYPGGSFRCRDHGELYYREWRIARYANRLDCSTDCPMPRVSLSRNLQFNENILTWNFKINNLSDKPLFFLHVMHALMPVQEIKSLELPSFKQAIDENNPESPALKTPGEVVAKLLSLTKGTYLMLILNEVKRGTIELVLKNGMTLTIDYDEIMFPSLGIWWNNGGYPGEEGIKRSECAFEPIPGTCSNLEKSYSDGVCLSSEPYGTVNWKIKWTIK
jgi:hypothetical protein